MGWMMKGDNARDNRGIEKRDIGQTPSTSNNGMREERTYKKRILLRCGEDYERRIHKKDEKQPVSVTSIVQE